MYTQKTIFVFLVSNITLTEYSVKRGGKENVGRGSLTKAG
jgi:hypothetical protein